MKQSGTSCFLLLNWKGEFMYTTISTKNMSHEEWLDLRKTGIGGSDAGAVCGLNPYVSSIGVYLNKIGKAPEVEDNEAMRQGRDGRLCSTKIFRKDRPQGSALSSAL